MQFRHGVMVAIGVVAVGIAVVSQQPIRYVNSNSPGFVFGRGITTDPLDVRISTDGTSIAGAGTPTSPLTVPAITGIDFGIFGDGSDGASSPCGTISVDTSLSKTINCTSLTINSGVTLTTNGWEVRVAGTLALGGKIAWNGNPATPVSGQACAGATQAGHLLVGGGAGGVGGSGGGGNSAGSLATCNATCGSFTLAAPDEYSHSVVPGAPSCNGAAGGNGGIGQGGGGGTPPSGCLQFGAGVPVSATFGNSFRGSWRPLLSGSYGWWNQGTRSQTTSKVAAASGGGGGGSAPSGNGVAGCGGGGGGNVVVLAKQITGSGSIEAKGGAGEGPFIVVSGTCTNCGGGGGGGGGNVFIVISTGAFPTTDVSGGLGGAGAGAGGAGGNGGSGQTVLIKAGA
jgi:hypothetical protein